MSMIYPRPERRMQSRFFLRKPPKAALNKSMAAWLLTALLSVPLFAGCGGGSRTSDQAPGNTGGGTISNTSANHTQAKSGLNNKQKVAITLAGAAALYYLYRQHQNKQGTGKNGQYYQSKNGGIYYRDAQGRPVYVKPPSQPIQVQIPASEAQQLSQYEGYNGRNTGRRLGEGAY